MENIKRIAWDYLENSYVDNIGNMYKTTDDIPNHLHIYVRKVKAIKPLRARATKLRKKNID